MIKLHNLIAGEDIRSGGRGALRGQSLRTLVKNGLMVFISVFVYLYFRFRSIIYITSNIH